MLLYYKDKYVIKILLQTIIQSLLRADKSNFLVDGVAEAELQENIVINDYFSIIYNLLYFFMTCLSILIRRV